MSRAGLAGSRVIIEGKSTTAVHVVYEPNLTSLVGRRICFNVDARNCRTTVSNEFRIGTFDSSDRSIYSTFNTSLMESDSTVFLPSSGNVFLGGSEGRPKCITVGKDPLGAYDYDNLEAAIARAEEIQSGPYSPAEVKIVVYPGTYEEPFIQASQTSVCIESAPGCDPSAVIVSLAAGSTNPGVQPHIEFSDCFSVKVSGLTFRSSPIANGSLRITGATGLNPPNLSGSATVENCVFLCGDTVGLGVDDALGIYSCLSAKIINCRGIEDSGTTSGVRWVLAAQTCVEIALEGCSVKRTSAPVLQSGSAAAFPATDLINDSCRATVLNCVGRGSSTGVFILAGHRCFVTVSRCLLTENTVNDLLINMDPSLPPSGTWVPGGVVVSSCEMFSAVPRPLRISGVPGNAVNATVASCLLLHQKDGIFSNPSIQGTIVSCVGGAGSSGAVQRNYGEFVTTDGAAEAHHSAVMVGGDTVIPDYVLRSADGGATWEDITELSTVSATLDPSAPGVQFFQNGATDIVAFGFLNNACTSVIWENVVGDASTEVEFITFSPTSTFSGFAIDASNSTNLGAFPFSPTSHTIVLQHNRSVATAGVVDGIGAYSWIGMRRIGGSADAFSLGVRGITSGVYFKRNFQMTHLLSNKRRVNLTAPFLATGGSTASTDVVFQTDVAFNPGPNVMDLDGDETSLSVAAPKHLDLTAEISLVVSAAVADNSADSSFTAYLALVAEGDSTLGAGHVFSAGFTISNTLFAADSIVSSEVTLYVPTPALAVLTRVRVLAVRVVKNGNDGANTFLSGQLCASAFQ